MNNNQKQKGVEEAEIGLFIQQRIEREVSSRKQLEEAYCSGYDDGFRDGATAGYDKGYCEAWDEGFSSGHKEAKQEA